MLKQEIEKRTEELLMPILESNHFEFVDLEYVKEGADKCLRAYIDKEGGIRVDDCELVSRALEAELDKADYMKEAYILEVSSPGLLRPFKKDRDFARNIGKLVELHLFKAVQGEKDFEGILKSFDAETVTLELEDEKERSFARKDLSLVRQSIDFSDL